MSHTLEQQLIATEKALLREKRARMQVELQLEEFSQRAYESKQLLLEAYDQASAKQIHLQFLSYLASDILSEKTLDELLMAFVDHILLLSDYKFAMHCSLSPEHPTRSSAELKYHGKPWLAYPISNELLMRLQQYHQSHHDDWQELPYHQSIFQNINTLPICETVLCAIYPLSTKESGVIAIGLNKQIENPEFIQTINTAIKQLTSAIFRRKTEDKLQKNYAKLSATHNELKKTQKQLLQQEKMASLGQLAAGIAHEINNPLSYISSNIETLNDYLAEYSNLLTGTHTLLSSEQVEAFKHLKQDLDFDFIEQDIKQLIPTTLRGVMRVKEIVDSLKSFSRSDDGATAQPVSLAKCIDDSLKVVWNSLKYEHTVAVNLPADDALMTSGYYGKLQQVFVNFFVNAAQAMKTGGELSIGVTSDNDYHHIHIQDQGCGMDEATQRQIFNPFFTTKAENEGTGLGLSVSFAILQSHHTTIAVESEVDKGTTFTLSFPKSDS
ncbi:ATP-binding protein [Pseudoalteromonas tunicata]|uniref:sensor histidine kinase n=1 Tax=Pseudoalteromonas tunicata TaxID=314281 RepID=UPI00273DC80F|nr:ATP-binding protein [Pseudoalteromonas tunicata]MDP5212892.1 ATP-binding protein [Pseudoalteromonas tunicata]